jgi:hypothetical protein
MLQKRVRGKKAKSYGLPVDADGKLAVPLDKDGEPDYGRVLRYYRKEVHDWSAEQLARAYSQALRHDDAEGKLEEEEVEVTARWIQLMEQKNRVPTDPKRRWVLARLLSIPPLLFGLQPLTKVITAPEKASGLTILKRGSLDLETYQTQLRSYDDSFYLSAQTDLPQRIKASLCDLHDALPYTRQKEQIMELLSHYHQLFSTFAKDKLQFPAAIAHLNKAIIVAREGKQDELRAAAIYRRGAVFLNMADLESRESSRRQEYIVAAIRDFDAARSLTSPSSDPHLRGWVLLDAGYMRSFIAQTSMDLREAFRLIDESEAFIERCAGQADPYFAKFNRQVYLGLRAEAFLGSPLRGLRFPDDALQELDQSVTPTDLGFTRRSARNTMSQAKAYFYKGYYPMATALAADALDVVKNYKSSVNIARLTNLYEDLKESSYGNSSEVAQLGIALLKVQQPHLFH